jgi:hypothetical protein
MSTVKSGPVHHTNVGDVAYTIKQASPEAVQYVLDQSEDDDNGRSPFVWVWLPNGDLILGTFPQGDTYFATEGEHE